MTNVQIADIFDEIGDILEFQGANAFRVRAYRNAARTIKDLPEQLSTIAEDEDRKFTDIDGVGDSVAEKITTLLETGKLPQHEDLIAQVSHEVLSMLRIPGLGPKKAAALHKQLNIQSLDELRKACEDQKVRELKGFGAKTEEAILKGLDIATAANTRMLWANADRYAQALVAHLKDCPSLKQIELAGSYRRRRETVGDLDILVTSDNVQEIMDRFAEFDGIADVIARGPTKMSVRLSSALQVDLRVVPEESFGAALQYFTGSKNHNIVLRGMAKDRGLKINEYGVYDGDKYVAGRTEEDVYATLDMPYFPPEIRENRREFDWAEQGKLPTLIEIDDIQGDLHMHTTATDGKATLEEMIEGAKKRGLKYIAITDHSKRVSMANGLDAKRLREQWEEIDKLNEKLKGIQVLKGIECDILEKGGMDLDDDVLKEGDWIIASVHYGQTQPRAQITKRIVGALENPYVTVVAHPTGRLINRREPYEVDLEAVFKAAADNGKMLELNCAPERLDLDDVACAAAKKHGIPIVISTDAHSVEGLNLLRYGILQARRAGLMKEDVANTRTWAQMKKLLGRK